jgi:CubicO group peptidase (beta-lactamase class C family)
VNNNYLHQLTILGWMFLAPVSLVAATDSNNHLQINPQQLEHFVDGIWYSQKESHDLMGAVVTVVKDDEIILNKGYGFANYEKRIKVDSRQTLFRIASISKPFTWTAVMQLVEQGKLDLNEDVNTYLKQFQVPDTFPAPITMAHLMTHSAGFEDKVLDLGRRSAEDLLPLGTYLADHLPRRVRPAGAYSSYSNHSTALAAHIVEEISGKTWSDYIENNILQPLGMHHTVARHPIPEDLADSASQRFERKAGKWKTQDFLYWFIYPAGMMSTTGSDMARFMRAHLNGGQLDGVSVLEPVTTRQMHSSLFQSVPGGNDWLHGFYEMSRNNVRIFGHGGDLNAFHSNLMLFPDHNLGIFVSFNSEEGSKARGAISRALINYYFSIEDEIRPQPPENASDRYSDLVGSYGFLRRTWSDFAKLTLLIAPTEVAVNDDGYLLLQSPSSTSRFVEIEEDRFRSMDSQSEIIFVRDEHNEVSHLSASNFPAASWDRLRFPNQPAMHRILFGLVAFISLVYFIYWPVRWIRRRIYAVVTPTLGQKTYGMAWLTCFSQLGTLVYIAQSLGNQEQFYFGMPQNILSLLYVLMITCALMPVISFLAIRTWSTHQGTLSERINYTTVALSAVLYTYLSWYWNLLGYHLGFQ